MGSGFTPSLVVLSSDLTYALYGASIQLVEALYNVCVI